MQVAKTLFPSFKHPESIFTDFKVSSTVYEQLLTSGFVVSKDYEFEGLHLLDYIFSGSNGKTGSESVVYFNTVSLDLKAGVATFSFSVFGPLHQHKTVLFFELHFTGDEDIFLIVERGLKEMKKAYELYLRGN